MSRARELARLGNSDILTVDSNQNVGVGSETPDRKFDVGTGDLIVGAAITLGGNSGVVSATTFHGNLAGPVTSSGAISITDSTASTSSTTGALKITGGVGIAKSLFVGEGVSVAGTITYNDVTNIDSVGIVTARGGLKVGPLAGVAATVYLTGDAHFIGVVTAGSISGGSSVSATTYYGSGANLTGIEGGVAGVNTTGFSTFKDVSVQGISTFSNLTDSSSTTTGALVISGGVGIAKSMYVGGNIVLNVQAGRGIDFGAQTSSTATNATATQEVLTHYEYGTWTPVVKLGSTVNSGTVAGAVYTRIGNLVVAQCTITSISESGSGDLKVEGIPFSRGQGDPTGHIRWQGITSSGQIMPYIGANTVYMQDINTSGYTGGISESNTTSTYNFYSLQLIYYV